RQFLVFISTVSPDCVCGSELKVTVRPGDNITLYCDCKRSTGVYIMWYRNCSHENQPSLVLKRNTGSWTESLPPNFHLLKNQSSDSYDLLILNITESDEGLYYSTATSQQESYSVSTSGPLGGRVWVPLPRYSPLSLSCLLLYTPSYQVKARSL
uniref:Ig-like domain-containing protein n=1 Tax=Labrus bergylta TaxID=56723 RepID=A0A3Q3EKX4_9LABR